MMKGAIEKAGKVAEAGTIAILGITPAPRQDTAAFVRKPMIPLQ